MFALIATKYYHYRVKSNHRMRFYIYMYIFCVTLGK